MEPINATRLREIFHTIPIGSTIFCRNPSPILCKIIRLGLQSDADHTATKSGAGTILEAKGGEAMHHKDFLSWISKREDNTFWVSEWEADEAGLKRMEDCIDKRYDYGAALFWMVIFQLTGLWLGPRDIKAFIRLFCHEASAYIRGFKKWWCLNRPNNKGSFR